MESGKSEAKSFIEQWWDKLDPQRVSRTDRIVNSHAFSIEVHARITQGALTDKAIYDELVRTVGVTAARNLIRLHELPPQIIKRIVKHIASGKMGASYSQLLYAMKMSEPFRTLLLKQSMTEQLSSREFKFRADEFTATSKRPICLYRQVDAMSASLAQLVEELTGMDTSSEVDRMDPARQQSAVDPVQSAITNLNEIRERLPDALSALAAIMSRLAQIELRRCRRAGAHGND